MSRAYDYDKLDADLLNTIESGSVRINQQSKDLNQQVKQGWVHIK